MTLVKPKAETREAWQYTGEPSDTWPTWVRTHCSFTMSGVLLVARRSGEQEIRLTEWLVRDLDGDPDWFTHDQMRKTFDEVEA